jgi:ABC-2 type transport system permease protein
MGFCWGFLKPLLYLLIFIIIFSTQFNSLNNYVLYATSGLIFWFFFVNATNQSIANIVGSSGLIKSLNIPVIIFPLSELISEIFNLLLMMLVFMVLMHWFGMVYSLKLLLLAPAILLFCIFSFGVMLVLSSLNVFFRDVGILWSTLQPALFYLTPIAYPESLIPARYTLIIKCNPIYYFLSLCRSIIYDGNPPSPRLWWLCIVIASVACCLGFFVFNKLKNQFIAAI